MDLSAPLCPEANVLWSWPHKCLVHSICNCHIILMVSPLINIYSDLLFNFLLIFLVLWFLNVIKVAPGLFWTLFAWNIILHLFTLSPYVSLPVNWVFCTQQTLIQFVPFIWKAKTNITFRAIFKRYVLTSLSSSLRFLFSWVDNVWFFLNSQLLFVFLVSFNCLFIFFFISCVCYFFKNLLQCWLSGHELL
jgi:hypothetical protein